MATLYLVSGMAGAGKTTLAKQLETQFNAVRFCPDDWIMQILADPANLAERDRLRDPVEQLQWQIAQRVLATGSNVILENGFWVASERRSLCEQGHALGARVELYYLDVTPEELWRRIQQRNATLTLPTFIISHAELSTWLNWLEPPTPAEQAIYDKVHIIVDSKQ